MPTRRKPSSSRTSAGDTSRQSVVADKFNPFWPSDCRDQAEPAGIVDSATSIRSGVPAIAMRPASQAAAPAAAARQLSATLSTGKSNQAGRR